MQSEPIRGLISKCPACNHTIFHTIIPDYIRVKMANINDNKLTKGICLNCNKHLETMMKEYLKKIDQIQMEGE